LACTSSVTTILLPAYISYKAVRTGDPAQTTPWLIYFIILSLTLLFESWTLFIIGWIPFYSWLRLIFLSYLVLPQTQGAKVLYLSYVEPFIIQHERDIDLFINQTHEKLESMGLGYMNALIDWLREKLLGQSAPGPQPIVTSVGGYAQSLLGRFTMPAARTYPLGKASDMYGMLSGVAGAAMGAASASMAGRSRDIFASGAPTETLIPDNMQNSSAEEKSSFLAAQRERLGMMMRALDKEQQNLDLAYGVPSSSRPGSSGSGLSSGLKTKSRSEQSFERVEYDDFNGASGHLPPKQVDVDRRTASGNWMPSSWFGSASAGPTPDDERYASKGWSAAVEVTEAVQEMSSGIHTRRRG
jgi:TB2/DP1, HVA22 family